MKKKYTIEFVASDKVNVDSYDLVRKLFGLEENFFLSNESTLNDFVELDDIPGHSLKKLTEIPKSERQSYITDEHFVYGVVPQAYRQGVG